jgi:hypothetical protein
MTECQCIRCSEYMLGWRDADCDRITRLRRVAEKKHGWARGHAPIHREPEPTPAPPRGTQVFIRASDGWHPVVSPEELEATIRQLRTVRAQRDEARRKWCELASAFSASIITAEGLAKERGWDCFEKEAKP